MLIIPEPSQIEKTIHSLERRHLDHNNVLVAPMWGELENISFLRVLGLADFWKNQAVYSLEQCMDDLVSSAYGQGITLYFLAISQGHRSAIYLGAQCRNGQDDETLLRTLLMASFPGIVLETGVDKALGRSLNTAGFFAHQGRLSGIPTRKTGLNNSDPAQETKKVTQTALQIDRVLRGMRGETWGFFVKATPLDYVQIIRSTTTVQKEIETLAPLTKRQVQEVRQTLEQKEPTKQIGETQSVSGDIVNKLAERAVALLEHQLERLEIGKNVGMWQANAYYFSNDGGSLQRGQSLLRAAFGGRDSIPEPVRVTNCAPVGIKPVEFTTMLTSMEVTTLIQLPREEVPGFRILNYAAFDVDQRIAPGQDVLTLGTIVVDGHTTPLPYSLPKHLLNRHTLISGITGSGKTTTLFSILDSLWNRTQPPLPFLVIEPTKSEYRALLGKNKPDGRPEIPLRVFTLGDETVIPFRLNPFEFEILDADHFIHVQTHIDYLKSVFSAAFVLYAPMPYVLEICLHEIYTDKGWNLTTSRNHRLEPEHWGTARSWPVFPTLQDLYLKIDQVTDRLGYEDRIKMDVKAGLKTRLESLMIGGKGLMLNTQVSFPIGDMLKQPVVLELERIGNDEEKVFLMGLLVTRLYEFRRLQALVTYPLPFQHITVIEEAHRLLRNVPHDSGPDTSNVRGQAVETFTNLLAEIRAYGEGIVISEQIPSKLAPEVIKNTNLKITHRTIAEDDRRVIGGASNMSEEQLRFLAVLGQGQAVVFNEGDDHPMRVEIGDLASKLLRARPTDREIRQAVPALQYPDWMQSLPQALRLELSQGLTDLISWAQVNAQLEAVVQNPDFIVLWNGFMLKNLVWAEIRADFYNPVEELVGNALGDQVKAGGIFKRLLMANVAGRNLQQRGQLYGWSFEETQSITLKCMQGFSAFASGNLGLANLFLKEYRERYYQNVSTMKGPYVGCIFCEDRCLYRFDAAAKVQDANFRGEWIKALRNPPAANQVWEELALINQDHVLDMLGPTRVPETLVRGLSICLASQVVQSLQLSRGSQGNILSSLFNATSSNQEN